VPPPGYRDVSIPLEAITLRALVWMIPLIAVPLIPYWLIHGWDAFWSGAFEGVNGLWFVGGMVIGIIAHEVVHAVGWKFASGLPWRAFSFGIDRSTASPYCHADAPMPASAYRFGALLPSVITGILPVVIATAIASPTLALIGAVLFSAAVGDFIVVWVIRAVRPDARVLDHPTNAGCYVEEI
jgi:uncharacterized membrane protein YeaQ/YmgE (transglycosylase-associated protein family)